MLDGLKGLVGGHRTKSLTIGLAVALSCLFVLPTTANGSTVAVAKFRTPLQRGLAFYRGQTLTFVDHSTPGTAPDQNDRTIAQYMALYLHATVNVEDIPGGNTVPGEDTLAHATPNGLTFGDVNLIGSAGNVLTHVSSINFNPERLEYIGALQPAPQIIIAATSSPYSSLQSLKNANPPAKMLMQSSGLAPVEMSSLLGALGIHMNYTTGYASLSQYLAGFVRGDGPLMATGLGTLAPLLIAGQARAIFISNVPPVGTLGRKFVLGIPTLKSAEKEFPAKTKAQQRNYSALNALFGASVNTDMTQTSVPAYKLDALRAAYLWMTKQPGFKNAELAEGNNPVYVDPVVAKNNYIKALAVGSVLVPFFSEF